MLRQVSWPGPSKLQRKDPVTPAPGDSWHPCSERVTYVRWPLWTLAKSVSMLFLSYQLITNHEQSHVLSHGPRRHIASHAMVGDVGSTDRVRHLTWRLCRARRRPRGRSQAVAFCVLSDTYSRSLASLSQQASAGFIAVSCKLRAACFTALTWPLRNHCKPQRAQHMSDGVHNVNHGEFLMVRCCRIQVANYDRFCAHEIINS